ncbi:MAG: flavodoxin [Clostridia bacterium]|nr:flavodoxin [Clostridia bacterium]
MSKILVAYFSASGVTKKVAKVLAKAKGADLFQICPEVPYTKADLDWRNEQSRSSLEMQDLACRPAVCSMVENMAQYDVIFVGFPIWWGREPSVVDTFLTSYDFKGKFIIPFCTAGSSDIGSTAQRIHELTCANVDEGKRFDDKVSEKNLKLWADGLIQD